jgi:hypothetical protein
MKEIHDKKNSDYATQRDTLSNFKLCEEIGIPAFAGTAVRLSDKFGRVMHLTKKMLEGKNPAVLEETITDTLLDLCNYSLIMIILIDEYLKKGKKRKVAPQAVGFRMLRDINKAINYL